MQTKCYYPTVHEAPSTGCTHDLCDERGMVSWLRCSVTDNPMLVVLCLGWMARTQEASGGLVEMSYYNHNYNYYHHHHHHHYAVCLSVGCENEADLHAREIISSSKTYFPFPPVNTLLCYRGRPTINHVRSHLIFFLHLLLPWQHG
jgi:hypothetical protein